MDELLILNMHNDNHVSQSAVQNLESGRIIYLPDWYFKHKIDALLNEDILDGNHKNISFDCNRQQLGGYNQKHLNTQLRAQLKTFMHSFSLFALNTVETLLPGYSEALVWGRTSYRPAEIKGRASSKRKDDTRVHVDAFPSTPVHGMRILRVFCNINPHGLPRIWDTGEAFHDVIARFSAGIPRYNLFRAKMLRFIKATRTLRSPYDHYQLHLHDQMKTNDRYQQTVTKTRIEFPAQSTWLVFTDQVSHAALGGQYLLEQTFYLPVSAMDNPEMSPLRHWEKYRVC